MHGIKKLSKAFANFNDCIGKITLKSIRLQPFFEVNKIQIIYSKKMRISGNCINDYAQSFFWVDIWFNKYTGYLHVNRNSVW